MTRISTTPKTGTFAGRTVFTNNDGEGIFTKGVGGTNQQHTGTSQTPTFKTPRQLAAWLRKHYNNDAE